ncbi:MAG: rod shape-determining protein MreC [Rhodocyclaceae bacterium]|nr:rod shape-determining protein MreC [Rhodocyclaceae bacterium]
MNSSVGHSPPQFFTRSTAPVARLVFMGSLSVILLVADLRFHTLEWVRTVVMTMTWPLRRAVHLPAEAGSELSKNLTSLLSLQSENKVLQQRQVASAHLLLRQKHLEQENRQLRALLEMKERQPVEGKIAEILYSVRDSFSRRVIVSKGSQEGIVVGQSVVDDIGVIGQVTRVFPMASEITLLTDKEQAVPVQVERNGLRAVLGGMGTGNLELRFLATNVDVQPGDILMTSGLDGVYLPGLPAAKVESIERDNSSTFARIRCIPLSGIERHGLVLILGIRQIPSLSTLTTTP